MKKREFPSYHFTMRGSEAIRIRYEGQDLGVFDLEGLWSEYRKTIGAIGGVEDPNKRYVIERAIETFEGKIPRVFKPTPRYKPGKKDLGAFVPMWNRSALGIPSRSALPPLREIKRRRAKRGFLLRLLDRLRGRP